MAAPSTPLPLSVLAQEAVLKYSSSALELFTSNYNIRAQMELRDKAYYRTNDLTETQRKAKAANDSGDADKLQNITVPVVMPQVETALAELQEIFLSGYPIFATVAPPEHAEAMAQMDAIIGENSIKAGWPVELLKTLRDGLKYDFGIIEVDWQERRTYSITTPEVANISQGKVQELQYAGNFMRRINPYCAIVDTRVPPEEVHTRGEFAGHYEVISRVELKKRMENLPALGTMNFRAALESGMAEDSQNQDSNSGVYTPNINPDALIPANSGGKGTNWLVWDGSLKNSDGTISYKGCYVYQVLYARVLPSDLKITYAKDRNHVQIYKFVIINEKHVIFCERQTNAHDYLPMVVCKPTADGMGWQGKSFAENAIPAQSVATSLMNSGLESQRRKVYDRLLYDASRVAKKDIDKVSSVSRIPVKSSQYNKDLSSAVYQIPFRDEGVAEILQLAQQITQMGDTTNGTNRVQQGQFQKGNKTRKEFETVMAGASNRGRMRALALEYSFFVPIKEIIKSNILQYQPPTTILNRDGKTSVKVDPEVLRKAIMAFSLSDGYLPSEKMMSGELFNTIFQAAQAIPTIPLKYDIMGMFIYSMQLQGASWLKSFERSEEEQVKQLAQMRQASQASSAEDQPPQTPPTP